ncbi:relaxase/mobilization nuclease-like protein [Arcticibacter tournemirensis]|uniref:Relaxase/mobilization nuclease domain-containing protein n=1 Tax=Arcticibacter tournemirensis TaxID=699437 RepID=A0A5M9HFJ1_9SPHI|nr:relaxase/mobilization nuclease domain-containing protein [Arcticibacter tournemirensis]KAA8485560.1 relaxase/mobilization nuclease domain-containing protein [Arcticibacter tournemirensis]TQM48725.1 relaxase/mobilization nuclease-like protein [Arcticibacter tournemirensis]
MIGKVPKPGKSFGGCIEYNVLKKDAVTLYADGVRIDKIAHTINDFNMQRKMNPGLGQAVGHIALSWSPNDKDKLNDEKMVEIAKEYLQKMKIQDTQVLMVRHKDKEHPHLHIVYNRVNNQGKTISDKFQHYNNLKVSKQLTLKYGMYMGKGKEQVNRPQLKGIDKLKYELHDTLKAAIKKVGSIIELKNELAKQGIDTYFKFKGGTTEIQGISFGKGKYKFKGSEIDRSLSYGKITQAIQQNVQQRQSEQVQHKQFVSDLKAATQSQIPAFPPQQKMGGKSLLDILFAPDYVEPVPYIPDTDERKKKRKKPSQSYNVSR